MIYFVLESYNLDEWIMTYVMNHLCVLVVNLTCLNNFFITLHAYICNLILSEDCVCSTTRVLWFEKWGCIVLLPSYSQNFMLCIIVENVINLCIIPYLNCICYISLGLHKFSCHLRLWLLTKFLWLAAGWLIFRMMGLTISISIEQNLTLQMSS